MAGCVALMEDMETEDAEEATIITKAGLHKEELAVVTTATAST